VFSKIRKKIRTEQLSSVVDPLTETEMRKHLQTFWTTQGASLGQLFVLILIIVDQYSSNKQEI